MTWKTDYLANLFELIAADGVENRELLALFEIERRLHAKITEFIEAFTRSDLGDPVGDANFNPLVDRRHLSDLFALAHLDATVSALEQSLIDRFVKESGLPDAQVAQLRQRGEQAANELIRAAVAQARLGGHGRPERLPDGS